MNSSIALSTPMVLAVYCGLVFVASLAGGWALLAMRLTHARLQMAVSFVAGLMLGVATLHFLPHAAEQTHSLHQTMLWVLGGFLAMFFLQRFFPHHHHDVSEGAPEQTTSGHQDAEQAHMRHEHCSTPHTLAERSARQLSWSATAIGMTFHSLLGGMALAVAVAAKDGGDFGWVGLGTGLVIILHKPFDSMAVSTLMAASGCSIKARHWFNGLFALVTPLGAVLFFIGANQAAQSNPNFLGGALAFCAGTFLCISCADLLPELQFHSHDRLRLSIGLLAGLGIALLISQAESGHEHHHDQSSKFPPGFYKSEAEIDHLKPQNKSTKPMSQLLLMSAFRHA
jgi:zinc and cadmium transporter